jgi:uncharacterized protein (DUF1800 family)
LPTSAADVDHLLRRVGFGVTQADLARFQPLDRPALIDAVLDTSAAPAVVRPPELRATDIDDYQKWVVATLWWIDRMRTTPAPVAEKLALFWHGHLVSSVDKADPLAMFNQIDLFRSAGLGRFPDLAKRVAVDPAMLLYLDNHRNRVGSPNENFARESLELFLLGVHRYTQADVVAAARAWTGHGLDASRTAYVFHAAQHDTGQKTFLGVTKNWDGPDIIDHILTGLTRVDAARHLAAKLWAFLAYPNPEPAVVAAVADVYLAGGLSVRSLVRAILERPEFWSARARRALVRTPIEYVVASLRATGVPATAARPDWYLRRMGQQPFAPPNVSGWRQNGYWINSSTLWAKADYAGHLRWKARDAGVLPTASPAVSAATAVQRAFDLFGVVSPSPRTRSALEAFVTAERATSRWAEQPNLILSTLLTPDFQLA